MSPLTAAPDSSPFPTPCRKLAGRRFNKRGIRREFLTSSGSHKPKIIQTPHWHLSDAKRQSTGYRGLNELDPTRIIFPEESTPEERLEMLKEAGYRIVEFEEDGRVIMVADRNGTCIACIAPPTHHIKRNRRISRKLRKLQNVTKRTARAPRGSFKVVEHGFQMGGGSKVPTPRCQIQKERAAAHAFFNDSDVREHLSYVQRVFKRFFPRSYIYYWKTLSLVSPLVVDGSPPSRDLPFASFTLNVGDQCTCGAHKDSSNLACGLCLASPFGDFDYRKGGHLILHELKLVFEVPAGSVALFPSALLTHENIPIASHETRQAITSFTPGTLFQWADNGFRRINEDRLPKRGTSTFVLRKEHLVASKMDSVWKSHTSLFPHTRTVLEMCDLEAFT